MLKESIKYLILQEISRREYDNFMDNLPGEPLPFDNDLFGGSKRKRVVVPFVSNLNKEIGQFLEEKGYQMDLERGVAIKAIQTQKGSKNVETKIGKVLNLEDDRIKKDPLVKEFYKYFEFVDTKGLDFTDYSHEEAQALKEQPHFSFKKDTEENHFLNRRSEDQAMTVYEIMMFLKRETEKAKKESNQQYLDILEKLQQIVNPNRVESIKDVYKLNKFIKKYNQQGSGMSYIVSRSPLDVLRMSDFKNIESCHSEGGSYWHCAVQEGKRGGAVVFLVKNESLKNVDLEEDEIFEDPDRGIEGIKPISRVRLRRFQNKQQGYDLAVPETSTYGNRIDGFLEGITKWAFDKQKHKFIKRSAATGTEHIEYPDMHDFILVGGSYRDSTAGELFNNFFGVDHHYRGDVTNDSGDEQSIANQYEEECQQFLNDFEAKASHVSAYFQVDDENGDEAYVNYSVSFEIKLGDRFILSDLGYELVKSYRLDETIRRFFRKELNVSARYEFDVNYSGRYDGSHIKDNTGFEIRLSGAGVPDDFNEFLDEMLNEIDSVFHEIKYKLYLWLHKEGIIESEENHFQEFLSLMDSNPFEYIKDVEIDEDNITFGLEYAIRLSLNRNQIDPEKLEKFFRFTNAPGSEKFARELTDAVNSELEKRLNGLMSSQLAQMFLPGIEALDPGEPIKTNGFYLDISFNNQEEKRFINNKTGDIRYAFQGADTSQDYSEDNRIESTLVISQFFGFTTEEIFSTMKDEELKSVLNFMKYIDNHYWDLQDMLEEIIFSEIRKNKLFHK